MNKNLWIIGLLFGAVASTSACEPAANEASSDEGDEGTSNDDGVDDNGGGGGTREAQLCERAAECLYLEAGYTVGDCTDIVESCTDELLTSAHLDWNGWADDCLGLNNCMNFGACYRAIDVCTLYVEVDVVEDGSSGSVEPPSDDDGNGTNNPSGADTGPSETTGGGGCGPDAQACLDDSTIEACIDGEYYVVDCFDACIQGGWSDTVGCGHDPETGVDICLCE